MYVANVYILYLHAYRVVKNLSQSLARRLHLTQKKGTRIEVAKKDLQQCTVTFFIYTNCVKRDNRNKYIYLYKMYRIKIAIEEEMRRKVNQKDIFEPIRIHKFGKIPDSAQSARARVEEK